MIRFPVVAMRARPFAWLTITALSFTPGCSSFNRAWEAADQNAVPSNSLAGRWEGKWHSGHNGHQDALRGLFSPATNGVCQARFHARYSRWGLHLSFSYTVPLHLQSTNDVQRFRGEANLGWYAGGVYQYEGTVSATNFFSTYRCRYDHGEFQMHRPAAAEKKAQKQD